MCGDVVVMIDGDGENNFDYILKFLDVLVIVGLFIVLVVG